MGFNSGFKGLIIFMYYSFLFPQFHLKINSGDQEENLAIPRNTSFIHSLTPINPTPQGN